MLLGYHFIKSVSRGQIVVLLTSSISWLCLMARYYNLGRRWEAAACSTVTTSYSLLRACNNHLNPLLAVRTEAGIGKCRLNIAGRDTRVFESQTRQN